MAPEVASTTEETNDMGAVKRHWITALSVLAAVFLVFFSVASRGSHHRRVVAALGALALVGGLLGLRTERLKLWMAHTLIIVGAVVTASFFWLLWIPTIIGLTVVYAGVIKRGLERELRPADLP